MFIDKNLYINIIPSAHLLRRKNLPPPPGERTLTFACTELTDKTQEVGSLEEKYHGRRLENWSINDNFGGILRRVSIYEHHCH